jgi:hypothetical protein
MNDDPIDRLLGRIKEHEIPAVPANLESRVLRSIRTTPATHDVFSLSWRLPVAAAALFLVVGWIAGVAMFPQAAPESPERARLALSLEAFAPSILNLSAPFNEL